MSMDSCYRGLTAPGASAAPLQVVAGPEPPAASALRGLGCVLLVMGVSLVRQRGKGCSSGAHPRIQVSTLMNIISRRFHGVVFERRAF